MCAQAGEQFSGHEQCNCSVENMNLEDQVRELRCVVKKMKEEKRLMIQAHIRELRLRDVKEIGLYVVVASLAFVYVLWALF